jgi:Pyrimidine dimer DNA glycosylase
MQTFLPYADFKQSAKVLDRQRLGKQRVEVYQLLNSITKLKAGEKYKGWTNHPCRKMWHNHTNALVKYGVTICEEWISRGYKDTMKEKITGYYNNEEPVEYPKFVGNEAFHTSHRSKLIQKKPEHYEKLFPNTPNNLEYIWPI